MIVDRNIYATLDINVFFKVKCISCPTKNSSH